MIISLVHTLWVGSYPWLHARDYESLDLACVSYVMLFVVVASCTHYIREQFSQFLRNLDILCASIACILTMDIGRRNTRKYNFRCPDLKELRKLTSFVDDPKDLRDHFGRLLTFIYTDHENGLFLYSGSVLQSSL